MNLLYKIFGHPKKTSLENRLFNYISLVNGILNIIGSFFVFYLPNALLIFGITFGSGILFVIYYLISRFKSYSERLFWPFTITLVTFLSINWITNAGSLGGSHYYFIPALVISTIIMRHHRIIYVYLVYILLVGFLFTLEHNYPEFVTNHTNAEERFQDAASNYIFVLLLNGLLIFILVRNLNSERDKSESLLLNILPSSVAEELKSNDIVQPKSYESVSVLFTDMAGFTKISETMTPEELIYELDEIFSEFDRITEKYKLEKIKTIGDSYMAVSGLPQENIHHAINAVLCSLEIVSYMREHKQKREALGKACWELRLGIHSGKVVAGVVGKNKFAYDIWGDTVNTASRLESSGLVGQVNISNSTYDRIKDYFYCENRGNISAKNKGEIQMYLVHGLKKEYRLNENVYEANEEFRKMMDLSS
ncbi:MAG: adenylate cyclase [Leptospira sp.]|nr:MAG: adenylate cyclase [Leptospira sp.]